MDFAPTWSLRPPESPFAPNGANRPRAEELNRPCAERSQSPLRQTKPSRPRRANPTEAAPDEANRGRAERTQEPARRANPMAVATRASSRCLESRVAGHAWDGGEISPDSRGGR